MKQTATRRIAVLGALALGLAGAAVQAQPPAGGNQGGQGGNRPDFRNMTPEQREQWMQTRTEERRREQLTRNGVTDKTVQDTVVLYLKAQDTARRPIAEQARKVNEALANRTPDAQVFALFNDLRKLIEAEKARIATDQKTLDNLVGYSKNQRLGVVLTMMGIIGDESSYIGGGGFGGFGGFGGGQGGRGGGQGGGNN